ncbi:zinc ABC transporter substrate-binding protein [Corynebacterium sp. Marseille-P3884]|uniref:metal ABC transporter solute-binding protein, Zn/Mn family n=1 Tax=Corynebacterium sp. Marseille-P3884 TaxID=2495409 RepID=UPI001B33464F|nr:zinc ABC transporter substrate-binding protein [Corynebacterium sp. Marseille-P3884]MBP3948881.1 zinc ABC transporter substrate-binding protein [Corynebacterium sp. Marseille-P3884]
MQKRHLHRPATVVAAALLVGASLSACSSDSADTSATGTDTADSSDILATTPVWADVAAAVTDNDVEAVINGTDIDPHHFEPSAKDLARVREAGTLVANGGPYDASLYTVAEQDRIIHAVPLVSKEEAEAHKHAHEHGEEGHEGHDHEGHDHDGHDHGHSHGIPDDPNELEHAWFSPEKVKEVAAAVKEKVGGSTEDVDKRMGAVEEQLAALPHTHIAMTESIAAPLVWGTELHDITPEGYMKAAINEAEPSVQDVAAFVEEIEAGHVDVLIVNPQSTNSATEQLANAARENNVPIVEMRETPPEGVNFLDYFDQVVDELVETVGSVPHDGEEHMHGEDAA